MAERESGKAGYLSRRCRSWQGQGQRQGQVRCRMGARVPGVARSPGDESIQTRQPSLRRRPLATLVRLAHPILPPRAARPTETRQPSLRRRPLATYVRLAHSIRHPRSYARRAWRIDAGFRTKSGSRPRRLRRVADYMRLARPTRPPRERRLAAYVRLARSAWPPRAARPGEIRQPSARDRPLAAYVRLAHTIRHSRAGARHAWRIDAGFRTESGSRPRRLRRVPDYVRLARPTRPPRERRLAAYVRLAHSACPPRERRLADGLS